MAERRTTKAPPRKAKPRTRKKAATARTRPRATTPPPEAPEETGPCLGILEGYEPPSREALRRLTAPLRTYFAPKFLGTEHLDRDRPALYVGNHTIYGLIDVSLLGAELYLAHDIYVRGLADRGHFAVPGWRDTLLGLGAVVGTRENCDRLMEKGEHVLVFPGGGREVARRRDERYKLIWKNRTGFARMAIRHGYPIIPFAQVGVDDAYDIVLDANDIMNSPIGAFLSRVGLVQDYMRGGETLFPIARGLGLTMLPRPERFYFGFVEPIETKQYEGREEDEEALYDLRDRVRDAVRDEIMRLVDYRKTDREVGLLRRLLTRFG